MRKFFGTDGMRGRANAAPMTPDIIMKVAVATGSYFKKGRTHPKVVIGKDTRLSGYMIEPALVSGFVGVGMDVMLVGPLPTPAISMLVRSLRADLGVMISASHNPHEDNGIKLFDRDGFKLSDQVEREIEARVMEDGLYGLVPASELGRAKRLEDAPGRYIEFVKSTFPKHLRLDGLKIILDCAHGAAYKVAPTVFWELGADVISIGDQPDGFNINHECGATNVSALQEAVLYHQADVGIALDGDADRIVMIDEKGKILDGDQLLAVIAKAWLEKDTLRGNCVVGTSMTNLGFERFLDNLGLRLIRTPVGDRYVSEYMRTHQCNVGGEQSGHIILSDYARTGDGLVGALQILAVMVEKQKRTSELSHIFTPFPQVLKNIRFQKEAPLEDPDVQKAIETAIEKLGLDGSLVVRKSGTEPLIRLMAQGENEDFLHHIIDDIIFIMDRQGFIQK
ncbi:phosphoglucosamine mutase [Caedimonas varicaedens]|uniref:Phosphoglucosamine mutase n=1 Tax=Caedimonas varicaedens TaxID=1629334 RepID=A0A0K8MF70_9PROT|nr:phosphoglucosamine mutase [Caedimonas varicaedens]